MTPLHHGRFWSLCVTLAFFLAGKLTAAVPIEVTCVDADAIGYATFQSHNQKVVANRHGIFMTHLRRRNEDYTAQTWRLSRSTDGGHTFQTLTEETHPTNPPVLETDEQGQLYLVRVDFQTGDGFLLRYSPEDEFRQPRISRIPGAAAGKYAMLLDAGRQRLYFFSHNNSFHTLDLSGNVLRRVELLAPGTHAILQYPLLTLDEAGRLVAAWTTQKHGEYLYWDIHQMISDDGGLTWRTLRGDPLALPVTADDGGAAERVTLDDEFDSHTWLASCLARQGKLHLVYLAQTQPPRQHYVRYDLASGAEDRRIQPRFAGEQIELRGLDATLVADREHSQTLYCLGHDQGHLACLVSHDRGQTWRDYARSQQAYHLYSLGSYRWVTDDGWIVGSFTDQQGSNLTTDHGSRVYLFRLPADREGDG
jgi:hypothetical protein